MRLLHAGPDLLGRRPDRGGQGEDQRRHTRTDERQFVPLRRLSQHRLRHRAGDGEWPRMRPFTYSRAETVEAAVRDIAATTTATVKFIAGGTNLLDLMKADVMRPTRLVDISRLPLDKIEENEDG